MLLNLARPGVFAARLDRFSALIIARSESVPPPAPPPLLITLAVIGEDAEAKEEGDDVAGIVGEAPLNVCP